ncbi:MotA/TolQ/ExbB proton channel family protein [Salinicola acroporae]|uniref:Flagellar motor protein MotA n=1 Tax=Salinicola acroporae TaxID=1541440 RepID=A0ABT6I6M8_9GAMM|nr:MotA/TolQ/ExbB proton channel family protein [Salinicola acroporae]MDH4573044.1 flagellar motor protein MotA [Salinicola acroporae]
MRRHSWWLVLPIAAITLLPGAVSAQSGATAGNAATSDTAASMQQVLDRFRADSQAAEQRDSQRLEKLLDDRQALQQAVTDAEQRLQQAQARRDELETRQSDQQQQLADLRQQRAQDAGDIGDISGIVKQQTSELRDTLAESWLTVGGDAALPPRLDDRDLVDLQAFERVRRDLAGLVAESGRGVRFQAPVAGQDGDVSQREVVRLGDTVAFSDGDLLQRVGDDGRLAVFAATPGNARQALQAFQQGDGNQIVIDPTDGDVLDALSQQPPLWQRFQQGGYVGYVIVALGLIGLLVALVQYTYLLRVSARMRRQMQTPDTLHDDNPLGRVLGRFAALGRDHAPEALEARLDEAMLAEQPRLERGQPIVKLIAAVAPLLGLLGTVTGMIVTFQSITVFGTGDPQLMAGGISQALVTTVLGLITAVPLLFVNTALNSRSRRLIGLLEGRASAVLAEHLEAETAAAAHAEERRHGAHA